MKESAIKFVGGDNLGWIPPLSTVTGSVNQKLKVWGNSKTQIVMKLKNSNCDEIQKLKLLFNSGTWLLMKLKNSNWFETQKLKWWQNSKTQIVIKKNSNCQKFNYDNTQIVTKLKLWQKSNSDSCDSIDSTDKKLFSPKNYF